MDARGWFRPTLLALAVAAAPGCVGVGGTSFPVTSRAAPPGKSPPPPPDNPAPATVVKAGGVQAPAIPPVPPTPLPVPPPTAQPTAPPGGGPAAPALPGASGPSPPPVTPAVPGPWVGGAVGFGPTQRIAPTAVGSLLQLGPNDNALDRVVELAKQLEAAHHANAGLSGKLKELESLGVGREQALAEALREVESATGEVSRARADLVALRRELQALRQRLEQLEKEDVETLQLVIAALDRLLTNPRGLP